LPGQDNPGYAFTLKRFFTDLAQTIDSAPDDIRMAYLRMKTPPAYELYDLKTDPYEFRNLATDPEYAESLARLKAKLSQWRTQTSDPLLKPANLKRLKAEIDACIINGEARKNQLHLSYPEYFF
jgi:hypothetical protein